MTRTQLRHRERLRARHEAALARWSDHVGDDFRREMQTVVQALTVLVREAEAVRGEHLERARTWRYLGEAHATLGNANDPAQLRLAVEAYAQADVLLQDPRQTPSKRCIWITAMAVRYCP